MLTHPHCFLRYESSLSLLMSKRWFASFCHGLTWWLSPYTPSPSDGLGHTEYLPPRDLCQATNPKMFGFNQKCFSRAAHFLPKVFSNDLRLIISVRGSPSGLTAFNTLSEHLLFLLFARMAHVRTHQTVMRNRQQHSSKWFSTSGEFASAPRGTPGDVWTYFWLSQLELEDGTKSRG